MVQYSGNAMHARFVRYIHKGRGSGLLNTIWRAEHQRQNGAGLLAKPLSWRRCCIMGRACQPHQRCGTVGVRQSLDGNFACRAAMIHDQGCFSCSRSGRKLWGWRLAYLVAAFSAPHRPCYTRRADFRSCIVFLRHPGTLPSSLLLSEYVLQLLLLSYSQGIDWEIRSLILAIFRADDAPASCLQVASGPYFYGTAVQSMTVQTLHHCIQLSHPDQSGTGRPSVAAGPCRRNRAKEHLLR